MTVRVLDALASFVLLPELRLDKQFPLGKWGIGFGAHKVSDFEVCPRCATPSRSVHSLSVIKAKDAPIRGKAVFLFIKKRRFRCKPCQRTFTEPIPGIAKHARTTKRLVREVKWATDNFSTMKRVEKQMRLSSGFVFKAAAEEGDKKIKQHSYPLPTKIGIDEHSLQKPKYQATRYATIIVDHKGKRVYDIVDGRAKAELLPVFEKMAGRENVQFVTMDMSESYRSLVRSVFPKATIVVDRFHVQRALTRLVNRFRKKQTGDVRKNPIRKLLLRNEDSLEPHEKEAVWFWLNQHPEVREVYRYKEAMRRMYRSKGLTRATRSLLNLLTKMQASKLAEVRALAKTLTNWKREILAYHKTKLTNARCEGFNRKAKLRQREAFGYRNFENYRRRVLNDCF